MNLKAIVIKLIATMIIVFSIYGIFYDVSFFNLFLVGILTTTISYVVGDLFILRRYGNVVASISDFFLAFLTLSALGYLFIETAMPIVAASLFAAFFMSLVEPFLHAYMQEQDVNEKRNEYRTPIGNLQTEFAEETEAQSINRKRDPKRDNTK
ncbi:YndM family protein [Paucisalibacillus sp. EB02]|uniref:YndM family protein n=1 Tax=Paucisalibacillus sp. EB02 TaxID=1347087 RepID=UPI0004B87D39|nr:YndM family protein [Paucisalibacillus sp. EB02]